MEGAPLYVHIREEERRWFIVSVLPQDPYCEEEGSYLAPGKADLDPMSSFGQHLLSLITLWSENHERSLNRGGKNLQHVAQSLPQSKLNTQ